jgi:hypothetical protein
MPLKQIASAALGGQERRAARVLVELALQGYVQSDATGAVVGALTSRGRAIASAFDTAFPLPVRKPAAWKDDPF